MPYPISHIPYAISHMPYAKCHIPYGIVCAKCEKSAVEGWASSRPKRPASTMHSPVAVTLTSGF